ncbi:MAG TPA: aminotransferase class III-fold pyridoxal phosphate-dependent enzyme, partial [Phycisphaerae bacterium]
MPSKTAQRIPLPGSAHTPADYDGPLREEILALRKEFLNPGIFHYYKEPICIVEGHMQYLWDEQGKQYLDAIAGIVTVSVGHCHPKVTERIREQVGKLVHSTTIYLHPNVALLARELAKRMPQRSELKSSYFTNSGSEANEVALLMARLHTGNQEVLSIRNSYHGGSAATMGLTAVGTWKYPLPVVHNVKHVAPGYCYRCPFGLTYPACDVKCARSVEDVIRYETSGEIAAFIGEPIQGVGGVVTPPPEYFGIVYEIVRKYGGLCVADEVQTGFGRTGEHYWGFENWGVLPDIVTMAKGIGNGAPLGACTTRPEIAANMTRRIHFNTFGGNPVSTVQGLATLEIIDEEKLQARSKEIGGYLKQKL